MGREEKPKNNEEKINSLLSSREAARTVNATAIDEDPMSWRTFGVGVFTHRARRAIKARSASDLAPIFGGRKEKLRFPPTCRWENALGQGEEERKIRNK